ncbi:MAG: RIP metalloprotease RseP [Myxococcota bacterium]
MDGPTKISAFILFIGVLVFVHELGHFLAAKLFGVKVLKFSLGFGPPLLQFTRGETTYQIAAVPLGGYVRMHGDDPTQSEEERAADPDRARSFNNAPISHRAVIALAGPAFNLVFPIICFFAYFLLGPKVYAPVVGIVDPSRPAAASALEPGDRVLEVAGTSVYSFDRMREVVSRHPGEAIELVVDRDGERVRTTVVPDEAPDQNLFGEPIARGVIGVHLNAFGNRLGVADQGRSPPGVQTGDAILAVDQEHIDSWSGLRSALRRRAGMEAKLRIARPDPRRLGDVLSAEAPAPFELSLVVPEDGEPASLGWAPGSQFVRTVAEGGPADRAGIRAGDQVWAVDGHRTINFASFAGRILEAEGEAIEVELRRDGEAVAFRFDPEAISCVHENTKKPTTEQQLGFGRRLVSDGAPCADLARAQWADAAWHSSAPVPIEEAELSIAEAFMSSVRETGGVIYNTLRGIFKLFTNEVSVENVGGPVRLFQLASQAAELGLLVYLGILASVSVNLGLVNLLPIPVFDGGHLLLLLIEAIKRKPLSVRTREYANLFGLMFIISLFVLAMRNDILALDAF